jgi:cell division protease FtsH
MRFSGNRKWLLLGAVLLTAVSVYLITTSFSGSDTERTNLTQLLGEIRDGQVGEITVSSSGGSLEIVMVDGTEKTSAMPSEQSITSLLSEAGIPAEQWPAIYTEAGGQGLGENSGFIVRLLFVGALFVVIILLMRRMMPGAFGGSGKKNRFNPIPAGQSPVTFDDVAGAAEIKHEVSDIVDFLREPERFRSVGAHIPRGLMLVGPPGTGKTLLAKALAGSPGISHEVSFGPEVVRVARPLTKMEFDVHLMCLRPEILRKGNQQGGSGREQEINRYLLEDLQ